MTIKVQKETDYLRSIAGNIWYFEVLVLLASLLEPGQVQELISAILGGSKGPADSAYRAMLAAECLQSSSARGNNYLTGQVFDGLRSCIQNKETAKVDKVECWQTLGRMHLGGLQLGELPQMMDDDSRFVREEALKTVASLSQEPIPGCRPTGQRLIWEAAKLCALDRLREYREWVLAPSLRSFTLVSAFTVAVMTSLLFWILPVLICPWMAVKYLPSPFFGWATPLLVVIEVSLIEVFLWLNEDKRSWRRCFFALRGAVSRLRSENRIERFRAIRAYCFWIFPQMLAITLLAMGLWWNFQQQAVHFESEVVKQEAEAAKQEIGADIAMKKSEIGIRKDPAPISIDIPLAKWEVPEELNSVGIRMVANALSITKDIKKYLVSNNLATEEENFEQLEKDPQRRQALVTQVRRFADLVDDSGELSYETNRENLAKLFSRYLKEGQPANTNLAADIVYSLRREARKTDSDKNLRFDEHYQIKDKEKYMLYILPQEIEFLSKNWRANSYLRILIANEIIPVTLVNQAEQENEEEWFASASRQLLNEIKRLFSENNARPVPRSSTRGAFKKLGEVISDSDAHSTAVQIALNLLKEDRERWFAARKEAEEARLLAEKARRLAEEARQRANEERYKQIAIGLLILFVLACLGWLSWKYIIPRLQLLRLDASLMEDLSELLALATDNMRDLALRKAALRKLARSDVPSATVELISFLKSPNLPEPLSTEAHRVLHQQQRRQMRRASTA